MISMMLSSLGREIEQKRNLSIEKENVNIFVHEKSIVSETERMQHSRRKN